MSVLAAVSSAFTLLHVPRLANGVAILVIVHVDFEVAVAVAALFLLVPLLRFLLFLSGSFVGFLLFLFSFDLHTFLKVSFLFVFLILPSEKMGPAIR